MKRINNKNKTKTHKIKQIHHDDHFSAIYIIVGNDEIHNFYAHIIVINSINFEREREKKHCDYLSFFSG